MQVTLIECGKIENPENPQKEKYAPEKRPKENSGRGKRTILLAGCAEVIKSRQIFSLSRRVSDTYIILKGLFREHYTRDETSPSSTPIRSSRDDPDVLRVAA